MAIDINNLEEFGTFDPETVLILSKSRNNDFFKSLTGKNWYMSITLARSFDLDPDIFCWCDEYIPNRWRFGVQPIFYEDIDHTSYYPAIKFSDIEALIYFKLRWL